jgi:hypothetical protein
MPPTFHYCTPPNPSYTYKEEFDHTLYDVRITSADKQVYWDESFTRPGEFTPTFIHTTTTIPDNGSVHAWSEISTHKY